MLTRSYRQLVPLVLITAVAAGCSQNKMRDRIALLEQANHNLTDQLNRCNGELTAAYADRDAVDSQLQFALDDAEGLRMQLAAAPAEVEAVAPGWTPVAGGAMIAIEGEVLFSPGKVSLKESAKRTLDGILSAIQGEYADKDIFVFGHTDDRPIKKSGWKDNWQLSTERALAVVRYLGDHGATSTRLAACGAGEHRPRVGNTSQANRAKNRRVEIYAVDREILASR